MNATLCASAYFVNAHTPKELGHACDMGKTAHQILVDNVTKLAAHKSVREPGWMRGGRPNQSHIAKVAGISQSSVGRVLNNTMNPTLGSLEAIARRCFKIDVWQLKVPDLDPNDLPAHCISEAEHRFVEQLRDVHRRLAEPPHHYG